MKIAVIQPKMIGDVLITSVIFEELKQKFPTAELHFIVNKNTIPVLENNPFIDKVIFFEPNDHKGLVNLYKFGKQLKKEKYETIIDVYGKWDSILPAYFSGAKMIVGHYKWYTQFFYTDNVHSDSQCHGAANAYRLLLVETALKKKVDMIFPKIHLTETEISEAKKEINKNINNLSTI